MRISESIREDLFTGPGIGVLYKRILFRNSKFAIVAVITLRIYTNDRTPYRFHIVRNKWKSSFCTATIANSNIQKPVVFVSRFGQRIKSDLLHTMDTGHHVDAE